MEYTVQGRDVVVTGVTCLNLALTLDCGQAFRWKQEADGVWSGVAGGHFLRISEQDGVFRFENTDEETFLTFWTDYFDLNKDYDALCARLMEDSLLAETVKEYYGIRILNQEPWEALCTFIISQQNNIKRIRLIVERLCAACGTPLENGAYAFPSAEQMSRLSEADFIALGAGYRAKYLVALSQAVATGSFDINRIASLPPEEAKKTLMSLYGVGTKVADCAMLFGFRFYSAFPLDVWMKRVMAYYPDGLPACFAGIEGIAQQYLFHWARQNLTKK